MLERHPLLIGSPKNLTLLLDPLLISNRAGPLEGGTRRTATLGLL